MVGASAFGRSGSAAPALLRLAGRRQECPSAGSVGLPAARKPWQGLLRTPAPAGFDSVSTRVAEAICGRPGFPAHVADSTTLLRSHFQPLRSYRAAPAPPAATLRDMSDPWEIERAVERGYRRARGEFVPDDGSAYFNRTCCCLVPAILFAVWVVIGVVGQVVARLH